MQVSGFKSVVTACRNESDDDDDDNDDEDNDVDVYDAVNSLSSMDGHDHPLKN